MLKTATASKRTGRGRTRDRIVFAKMVWSEAFSYISPLQTMIIFSALITPAVMTVNVGLLKIGDLLGISNPIQFPIALVSLFAVIALVGIFLFGIISVRHIGTYRTTNEYSSKMNPGMRLIWSKEEEILNRLDNIEELLKKVK